MSELIHYKVNGADKKYLVEVKAQTYNAPTLLSFRFKEDYSSCNFSNVAMPRARLYKLNDYYNIKTA